MIKVFDVKYKIKIFGAKVMHRIRNRDIRERCANEACLGKSGSKYLKVVYHIKRMRVRSLVERIYMAYVDEVRRREKEYGKGGELRDADNVPGN